VSEIVARPGAVTHAGSPVSSCREVTVSYGRGRARIVALDNVSIEIGTRELVTFHGPSGCGKTTLFQVLGGLVVPESGEVLLRGERLSSLDVPARGKARAGTIAYVFQGANLLPHLSVEENLEFARLIAAGGGREIIDTGLALGLVGLEHKRASLPADLSGGEQQRVAIARAVVQSPDVLLCDEPTGHLDSDTGARVLNMLMAIRVELGLALAIATHDESIADRADRAVRMEDGRVVSEEPA
jgi:putative ABC transport system ATP-binding protein